MLLLLPPVASASVGAGEQGAAEDVIGRELDFSAFEQELGGLDAWLREDAEELSLGDLWAEIRRGNGPDWGGLLAALPRLLLAEVLQSGSLLAQLLILALLSVLLTLLKDSFAGEGVALLSRWVVYMLLIALAVLAAEPALSGAREAVDRLSDLMLAVLPLMLPLLAAIGGVGTVSLISPLLLMALNLMMGVMKQFIFPLIYYAAILRLLGDLAPRFRVSQIASLFKDIAIGTMSILTTVFMAVLSLTGVASAASDGLAVKAAKTAGSAFIPVVGRTLADALDSVLATALLLKNGLGLVGAAAILLVCAVPALKLLAQALLFRLAAALIQPLGDEGLAQAVGGLGNSLMLLFAAVAVSGLFAFFSLALTVLLGNITMMMR